MKKAIISLFVIVAFAIYSLHARNEQGSATVTAPTSLQANTSSDSSSSTSQSTTMGTPSSTSSPNVTYKDGTYTGSQADALYGYIQVKIVVNGGKLTDVQFLQYPNDQRESQEINSQAMPLLKQETIRSQSVQIDGVSGATDTSQAFIESLSSALNQART
jgi:uncharacterized protein with FMN-binding domain